ncbi:hypothetical protein OC25_03825 [Pedobacter kyungheensis]|uniref:Carbohydrate-binding protein SusD n=1 Tax=Pedobacter kyungheensis TaxID=1069985 RepID=A0A0C1FTH2_9SPHI|nr:RagB/SusD family nutrient uptake outer membrane protein [Pedobacter kyungheensis]KIA96217.1 hypothetical protein OC25_03825 [Pedobacter kyungheensis]
MKNHIRNSATWLALSAALALSCNKLIEIPAAKDQIENGVVFSDSTITSTALLGAYYTMGTVHSSMKYVSLYADEYAVTSATTTNAEYANSQLLSTNTNNASLWSSLYSVIYQCNSILEGTGQSSPISPLAKKQLRGEAKFLRAFAYFNLVGFYDHIPLILGTEVTANRSAAQASSAAVFSQMVQDLNESEQELSPAYAGAGRVRANSFCASALLARIHLFQQNWQAAAEAASRVINSGLYNTKDVKPENVFLAGSAETILQLWMINGFLTDAAQLIPASATLIPAYPIRTGLYSALENTDLRKTRWISTNTVTSGGQTTTYPYPAKYKARAAGSPNPEFVMALRMGEQYLIRAEALAKLMQLPGSIADINLIRARAGLSALGSSLDQEGCLAAIADQRRIELYGEWGLRFLDLKRNSLLDVTLGILKPNWKTTAKAFPIPNNEIIYNRNLIQNDGY